MADAPRFLITRLSHVGDCVQTIPMAVALRRQWPDAFIAWAVEPDSAPLLEQHPVIDDVLVLPPRWFRSPAKWPALRRRLRSLQAEVSIDPQGLTKSAVLGWLAGARRRIGFRSPDGRELSVQLNNELVLRSVDNCVERYLELVSKLGVAAAPVEYNLPVDSASEHAVAATLAGLWPAAQVGADRRFVVVSPGAGWRSRLWSNERYAAVAYHVWSRFSLPVVLAWKGDSERAMANDIVEAALRLGATVSVAPPLNLVELAALLRRAHLFIGPDSGPMHLAAAVGCTCIGLFGATRWQQSGPYGEQHVCLQARYQAGSSRERRAASNDAMLEITSDDVIAACDRLLA